jgi:hypothetical protein
VEIGGEPKREGYMTEYIYGDVLFVINFSMDFIALFICGKIMHFKMNFWRMALAATIGGVYGVASLFFELGTAGDILVDVLMAMALCFVAHYHGSTLKTFGVTALFAAVSMLMGGAMTALYSKIGKYQAYIQIGGTVHTVFGDISFGVFAVIAVVSAVLTYVLQKLINRKTGAKVCTIRVTFEEGVYVFSAFVDTDQGCTGICDELFAVPGGHFRVGLPDHDITGTVSESDFDCTLINVFSVVAGNLCDGGDKRFFL